MLLSCQDQIEEHLESTHGITRNDFSLEEEITIDPKAILELEQCLNIETFSDNKQKALKRTWYKQVQLLK